MPRHGSVTASAAAAGASAGDQDDDESIRVAVRIRPLNRRELAENQTIGWQYSNTELLESTSKGDKVYSYDSVFAPETRNEEVYTRLAAPIVQKALDGFNGTVFTYGQTGSGKTHSILGTPDDPGIIRLSIRDIFAHIEAHPETEFTLKSSYLEVYNEEINDLLQAREENENGDIAGLNMRIVADDPQKGAIIDGLVEEQIDTADAALDVIGRGEGNRHYGSTDMNATSSRSHTIFLLVISTRRRPGAAPAVSEAEFAAAEGEAAPPSGGFIKIKAEGGGGASAVVKVAYLNLVDLAGSERQKNTNASGQRLKEGANINRSLLALGAVINKLGEMAQHTSSGPAPTTSAQRARAKSRAFIPYRDSKLTRILKQSLGGNTFTAMLCTMTPAPMHHEESVSTLKFGKLCKTIKNKATRNESSDPKALLAQYRQRIMDLKQQLAAQASQASAEVESELRSSLDQATEEAVRERERAAHLEAKVGRLQQMVMRQQSMGPGGDEDGGAGASAEFREDVDPAAPAGGVLLPAAAAAAAMAAGKHPSAPTRRRSLAHIEPVRGMGDAEHPLSNVSYEDMMAAFQKLSKEHAKVHRDTLAVLNVEKEQLAQQVEQLQEQMEHQRNQMYQAHEEELALMEEEMHEMQAQAESELALLRERVVGAEGELSAQRAEHDALLAERAQREEREAAERMEAEERELAAQSRVEAQQATISTMQEKIVGQDGRRLSMVAVELEQERLKMNDRVKNLSRREARLLEKETRIAVLMAELDERESTVKEKMLTFERQAAQLRTLFDGFTDKRRAVDEWERTHAAREADVSERAHAVEAHETELAERAAAIQEHEERAVARNADLEQRAAAVEAKEAEAGAQEARIAEREERIREWNGMLMTRESTVEAKEADLAWREDQLGAAQTELAEAQAAAEAGRRELDEAKGLHDMRAAVTKQQEQDLAIKLESVRRRELSLEEREAELEEAHEANEARELRLDKQQRSLMLREHTIAGKERDQDTRETLLQSREGVDADVRQREAELAERVAEHARTEDEFYTTKAAQINNRHRRQLDDLEGLLEQQHGELGKTREALAAHKEQLGAALEENKRLSAALQQARAQKSWLEGVDSAPPNSTKGLLVARLTQSLGVLQAMLREQGIEVQTPRVGRVEVDLGLGGGAADDAASVASSVAASPAGPAAAEPEDMSPARRILSGSPLRASPRRGSPRRASPPRSPASPGPLTATVELKPSSPKKQVGSFSTSRRF